MWYHWLTFSIIVVIATIGVWQLVRPILKNEKFTNEQKKKAKTNAIAYSILILMYDLFYMAIFNDWSWMIYTIGILIVITVFVNLTRAFLSENKFVKKALPFELLIGLGITVYLIYIIPECKLQNVVLTIIASVYGGLITLVGVAWTIKHSNQIRKEDIERIERERKEEERKKYIPYVMLDESRETNSVGEVNIGEKIKIDEVCVAGNQDNQESCVCKIYPFKIKNISKDSIIIESCWIDDIEYYFEEGYVLLEKDKNMLFIINGNEGMMLSQKIENIKIKCKDLVGNSYWLKCTFSYNYFAAPRCGYYNVYRMELPVLVQ